MEDYGFKLTFDGKIYFRVQFRNWTHCVGRQAKHDYLSAFVEGIQACGNPQAEYDDCEIQDMNLVPIILG
jgi:hypothetical protein